MQRGRYECRNGLSRVFAASVVSSNHAGIFWHTGENDTYYGPYAQNYANWMKLLIDRVRLDMKCADLPWFISEQHPDSPWRNQDMVNAGLNGLATSDRWVKILGVSHLPHASRHFGTRGTLLLGEEMANAYLMHVSS
jgi:hypothetical protein